MHRSPSVPAALALAAALAGCGGGGNTPAPCATPRLLAYWTPGGTPQAGFQVPGLAAAGLPAQLGCAQAGVTGVQVFVGTPLTIVPCAGGATLCVDANTWRCDISSGGITIPTLAGPGTYDVQIDAYGPNAAAAKYTRRQPVTVAACGDTAVGVFPQGLDGTMSLDYIFVPPSPLNCAAGSHMEWDLFRGTGAGAVPVEQGNTTCGTPNPFLVNGGASLAAGVYTLDRIAEIVPATPNPLSIHALCDTVIVHAGSEVVGGTEPVFLDLPASTPTCF